MNYKGTEFNRLIGQEIRDIQTGIENTGGWATP